MSASSRFRGDEVLPKRRFRLRSLPLESSTYIYEPWETQRSSGIYTSRVRSQLAEMPINPSFSASERMTSKISITFFARSAAP